MSAYLSPIGNTQQVDANGTPLSGGFIYTYSAGTTTPIATYTGSDGLTSQANPIVLSSLGLPASPIWLPAGQAVKLVIQNSAGVAQRTVDNVTGVNDPAGVAAATEWVVFTGTPTYISATSFSVAGDQTLSLQAARRLKTTNTGGTIYSTISASSYSAGITTVTVTNDSGVLDSGLSIVSYGLISTSSPSFVALRKGAVQATTSGTSIDYTAIPAWVKRITVSISGVSTSGTSIPMIQIGDSGGIETSGYLGAAANLNNGLATVSTNGTTGFLLMAQTAAASVIHGIAVLTLLDPATNLWSFSLSAATSNGAAAICGGGSKATSAVLDRIRLTTVAGTDTFDAGSVNVLFE